jgi:ankyrin repeat protein
MSLLEDLANAIKTGDSSCVKSLLESGLIDVNARLPREHNPPPLVFAVQWNARRIDIVEQLLSAGALVDGVDDNEETVCHAAVACNVDVLACCLRIGRISKSRTTRIKLRFNLRSIFPRVIAFRRC